MPCSAVECRREGTSLPVTIVRPVLDTDYSSRSSRLSDSYLRRSSLSSRALDKTTDYSRYTTSRMLRETKLPLVGRDKTSTLSSTSSKLNILKPETNSSSSILKTKAQPLPEKKTTTRNGRTSILSRSEESSGSRVRDSSRVRAHSQSDNISMATRPPRKPVTSFDVAEFRSLYSPDSYVVGSSSRSSDYSRSDSGYTSRSESYTRESSSSFSRESSGLSRDSLSGRPPLAGRLTSIKGTEPHPSAPAPSPSSEVTDENHNVNVSTDSEQVESPSNSGDTDTSSSLDQETSTDTNTSDDSQESLQPRIVAKTAVLSSGANAVPRKEPDSRDTNGLNGLRNIGNTCFLNSVVQCLSNTRLLKDYLINKEYLPDINNTESRGALIKSFAEVIQELWGGEGRIVNTSAFKSQVQKYAPRFMGYSQQDAQEFLRYLLQGIHDDVNRIVTKPRNLPPVNDDLPDSEKSVESWRQYLKYDDSRIVDLFVGQLKSTLRCTVCGHCSTTFEVFWDLSLPLPSRTGTLRLAQCLEHFTKEEVLDGDEMPTCCKCKTRRKCTKSFSIYKFPKILVLHLKRFSPSERYRKLSATVEFPITGLDMSGYGSSSSSPTYNLYAVSNHSGTAYSGHYTAYCLHPHAHNWHEYNDSRVSSISARNVVSSEAYILFYEQANPSTSVTTSRL